MCVVMLVGILQNSERLGSVYNIMPQWWHLMLLQYVAASFHLLSVSTANINTVQYPKTYKQFDMPTIAAVVISKVLLPQSNILAAFVHRHKSLYSDVCPVLPTYSNHNVTQFTVYSVWSLADNMFIVLTWLHKKCICCKIKSGMYTSRYICLLSVLIWPW
jgi:hypothetical protein